MVLLPQNKKLQINSVSISDDGSRCVFGHLLLNVDRETLTLTYLMGVVLKSGINQSQVARFTRGVFWVAVSGDGNYVASGGETSQTSSPGHPQGYLKAYKADTGVELLNITPQLRVNQVSLSLDGQFLAVCYGKTVEVYQLKS